MGITKDFSVYAGLVSNSGASINGVANVVTAIVVGNSTVNVTANTTVIFLGNSTVSATINSTTFSGTANNATNLAGVASGNYVTNTGNFTLAGNNVLAGTNTSISSNLFVTSSLIQLGNSTANSTTITTSGNVGIKNTAPLTTLHIGGNYQTAVTNLGTVNSTSNNTISFATANYFRGTIGGACTLTFSNIPSGNGAFGWAMVFANVGSNITWPAAVKWPSGTAPTFSSNTDVITFVTHDSGTTIYGTLSIKDAR